MKNNPENSSKNLAGNESRDLATLTDQNWLFINAFLQCGNIQKAYKIAGYKGANRSAPYQLYKQLKARIEDIGNLDITSRARLQADLKGVLDLPLQSSKKELTLSEWLRVRKFAASIAPDATEQKPQISVLVINRSSQNGKVSPNGADFNISQSDTPQKDVIDVTPEP